MPKTSGVLASVLLVALSLPANAQGVTTGKARSVFADPSDFVIELDKPGPCGSAYFHIRRTSENFKEVVAVALTAFSNDAPFAGFVASCDGDRNILSHGYVVH